MGVSTYFLTLSASENSWYDFFKAKAEFNNVHPLTGEELTEEKPFTEEDFNAMSKQKKRDLLAEDPPFTNKFFYERL